MLENSHGLSRTHAAVKGQGCSGGEQHAAHMSQSWSRSGTAVLPSSLRKERPRCSRSTSSRSRTIVHWLKMSGLWPPCCNSGSNCCRCCILMLSLQAANSLKSKSASALSLHVACHDLAQGVLTSLIRASPVVPWCPALAVKSPPCRLNISHHC